MAGHRRSDLAVGLLVPGKGLRLKENLQLWTLMSLLNLKGNQPQGTNLKPQGMWRRPRQHTLLLSLVLHLTTSSVYRIKGATLIHTHTQNVVGVRSDSEASGSQQPYWGVIQNTPAEVLSPSGKGGDRGERGTKDDSHQNLPTLVISSRQLKKLQAKALSLGKEGGP